MSLITDTWRQLVRRRLWPIAVLLLGALVAVPVLLAKSPAAPPPAPAPIGEASAPAGDGLAEPIVAVADDSSRGRRHVLGARKDPFAPAPQPKAKADKAPVTRSGGGTQHTSDANATLPSGGGSAGPVTTPPVSGGGTPASPVPTTPAPTTPSTPSAPRPKPAPGTLTVRFGDATADSLPTLHVKKLDALPDSDEPVAIYLGPGRSRHSAKFLVDSTIKPEGDGRCLPSPADCQTVELREGETEFFAVTGGTTGVATQYELDLVRIAGKAKARAARAHRARASHARAARAGVTVARVVRVLHP